jgi:amidohydrolase
MLKNVFQRLDESYDEMVSIRRDFHMHPELSFQEVRTPEKIAEYHKKLGLDVRTKVGGRGVVATLTGGKPGKTVALRADFDALPIQDAKDVPYKSHVDGVMHACGHDGHTATMLVLAKILSQYKEHIEGNIVFIHQFAEELTPGGAKPMIEDGCLDGVDAIFGTHLWSEFRLGTVGYREGHIMAAADRFDIEVIGKGGHGGIPQDTVDAIVTASQLVCNLQQVVSRKLNPIQSGVVTVGAFHSGKAFNAVSERAEITGTVRTFQKDVQEKIEEELERVTKHTCLSSDASYQFSFERGYPALWNHSKETQLLTRAAKEVVSEDDVFEMEPIMGGEDFAYYLQQVPGTFFFTGAKNEEIGANYPHHHPMFNIDERAMLTASKTLASAALHYLQAKDEEITQTNILQKDI